MFASSKLLFIRYNTNNENTSFSFTKYMCYFATDRISHGKAEVYIIPKKKKRANPLPTVFNKATILDSLIFPLAH